MGEREKIKKFHDSPGRDVISSWEAAREVRDSIQGTAPSREALKFKRITSPST